MRTVEHSGRLLYDFPTLAIQRGQIHLIQAPPPPTNTHRDRFPSLCTLEQLLDCETVHIITKVRLQHYCCVSTILLLFFHAGIPALRVTRLFFQCSPTSLLNLLENAPKAVYLKKAGNLPAPHRDRPQRGPHQSPPPKPPRRATSIRIEGRLGEALLYNNFLPTPIL